MMMDSWSRTPIFEDFLEIVNALPDISPKESETKTGL
jgi:hypothetical protein